MRRKNMVMIAEKNGKLAADYISNILDEETYLEAVDDVLNVYYTNI